MASLLSRIFQFCMFALGHNGQPNQADDTVSLEGGPTFSAQGDMPTSTSTNSKDKNKEKQNAKLTENNQTLQNIAQMDTQSQPSTSAAAIPATRCVILFIMFCWLLIYLMVVPCAAQNSPDTDIEQHMVTENENIDPIETTTTTTTASPTTTTTTTAATTITSPVTQNVNFRVKEVNFTLRKPPTEFVHNPDMIGIPEETQADEISFSSGAIFKKIQKYSYSSSLPVYFEIEFPEEPPPKTVASQEAPKESPQNAEQQPSAVTKNILDAFKDLKINHETYHLTRDFRRQSCVNMGTIVTRGNYIYTVLNRFLAKYEFTELYMLQKNDTHLFICLAERFTPILIYSIPIQEVVNDAFATSCIGM